MLQLTPKLQKKKKLTNNSKLTGLVIIYLK